jgi:phage/plasmid-associated DNA primase
MQGVYAGCIMLTEVQKKAEADLKLWEAKEQGARAVHSNTVSDDTTQSEQKQHDLLDSFIRTTRHKTKDGIWIEGAIHLEHGPIAAYLHELYHTISFNKMLFIYDKETGIYRQNAGDLEEEIRHIIESTSAKCSITRDSRDILAYITATNRKLRYPFNQHKDALPLKNGILKLNFETMTAELIPHSPGYIFTFQLPIIYDEKATGEIFHKSVISQYVDAEFVDALYQIPAQAILQALGIGPFKKSYILQGNADGGKTSYLAWLHALFGLENVGHVSLHQIGTDPFVNADLESRILNTFDDLADVPLQNIGPFKAMTGGFDFPINKKHMQRYNGRIFAVHAFTCNAPPDVPEKILFDSAFWSRWEYLHFDNVFPIDPNFTARTFTQKNLSGSFNRVIEMVFRIAKNGLVVNNTPSEVKDIWQLAADPFAQFISEHLPASSSEHKFDKEHLLVSFQAYCKEKEINDRKIPSSQKGLTTMAFKNGFKDARTGKKSERRWVYSAYRDWNPSSQYRESRT